MRRSPVDFRRRRRAVACGSPVNLLPSRMRSPPCPRSGPAARASRTARRVPQRHAAAQRDPRCSTAGHSGGWPAAPRDLPRATVAAAGRLRPAFPPVPVASLSLLPPPSASQRWIEGVVCHFPSPPHSPAPSPVTSDLGPSCGRRSDAMARKRLRRLLARDRHVALKNNTATERSFSQ